MADDELKKLKDWFDKNFRRPGNRSARPVNMGTGNRASEPTRFGAYDKDTLRAQMMEDKRQRDYTNSFLSGEALGGLSLDDRRGAIDLKRQRRQSGLDPSYIPENESAMERALYEANKAGLSTAGPSGYIMGRGFEGKILPVEEDEKKKKAYVDTLKKLWNWDPNREPYVQPAKTGPTKQGSAAEAPAPPAKIGANQTKPATAPTKKTAPKKGTLYEKILNSTPAEAGKMFEDMGGVVHMFSTPGDMPNVNMYVRPDQRTGVKRTPSGGVEPTTTYGPNSEYFSTLRGALMGREEDVVRGELAARASSAMEAEKMKTDRMKAEADMRKAMLEGDKQMAVDVFDDEGTRVGQTTKPMYRSKTDIRNDNIDEAIRAAKAMPPEARKKAMQDLFAQYGSSIVEERMKKIFRAME